MYVLYISTTVHKYAIYTVCMSNVKAANLALPQTVQHVSVGVDPQHDIFCGGVVDEGPLGVDKEHVWHPDLLGQPAVEGHALVVGAGEG